MTEFSSPSLALGGGNDGPESLASPARISAISASARHPGRFEILVDGSTVATLSLDGIERLGVRLGVAYTESLANRVVVESAALHTFDRALAMLAARPRAARDLERMLVRKGEPAEHVAAAVERLITLGALDDAQYARQFIRAKISGAGLSRRRLQSELWRKGVARDVIDAALTEVLEVDEVDEDAQIAQVAAKKLRTLRSTDPATTRRRLYAFLARRGYDGSAIRRVMDALPAGADSEADTLE
ncbi:MAG: RecX family transcriptional regulator [Gemmatimonadaceae bacterium]|nr:RecX family transcriptional regulator [Gemmatimonadaceae bacterium]